MKCAFNQNNICQRLNMATDENCKCPLYMRSYDTCACCDQPILDGGVFDNVTKRLFCSKCGQQLGMCVTCKRRNECKFETDPNTVPKMIHQTVRQGNIMSSFPVKNPNRIAITCKTGCECWSEEFGCLREFSSCESWEL